MYGYYLYICNPPVTCFLKYSKKGHYANTAEQVTDTHTKATFKALADAIIPKTHGLTHEYDNIQSIGAIDAILMNISSGHWITISP